MKQLYDVDEDIVRYDSNIHPSLPIPFRIQCLLVGISSLGDKISCEICAFSCCTLPHQHHIRYHPHVHYDLHIYQAGSLQVSINEMKWWTFYIALPSVACMQPQRCFTLHSLAGLFNREPSQLPGKYSATRHRITCRGLASYQCHHCLLPSTHSHLHRVGVWG